MDKCVDYNSIRVNLSEESGNDDGSDSDASDSSISAHSHQIRLESCTLIQNNKRANQTDVIYRRISNYMGDTRFLAEYGNLQIFSTHKSLRQNKSLKRFLFLFGFASTLILLSQLYLSLYFYGSSFGSKWTKENATFFFIHLNNEKKKMKLNRFFLFSFFLQCHSLDGIEIEAEVYHFTFCPM